MASSVHVPFGSRNAPCEPSTSCYGVNTSHGTPSWREGGTIRSNFWRGTGRCAANLAGCGRRLESLDCRFGNPRILVDLTVRDADRADELAVLVVDRQAAEHEQTAIGPL